jgi:hypothetical protein
MLMKDQRPPFSTLNQHTDTIPLASHVHPPGLISCSGTVPGRGIQHGHAEASFLALSLIA